MYFEDVKNEEDRNLLQGLRDEDKVALAIKNGATLLDVAYLCFNNSNRIKGLISCSPLLKKCNTEIYNSVLSLKQFFKKFALPRYTGSLLFELIENNRYTCVDKLLAASMKPLIVAFMSCNGGKLYNLAKSKSYTMVKILISYDAIEYFNEDIPYMIELIENGLDNEYIIKHPKYNEIVNMINTYKNKTHEYLSDTLPKEIIGIVNKYQLI